MKSKITKAFLGINLIAALAGCSTVGKALNPYEDEFRCVKSVNPGKCASTPEIYAEIMPEYKRERQMGGPVSAQPSVPCPECDASRRDESVAAAPAVLPTYTVGAVTPESAYRDASLAKAAKLLKEPVTPVVIPPSVMRILILPRKGEDGELNMAQFSFMMVDKPRWAIGDYLSAMPEE